MTNKLSDSIFGPDPLIIKDSLQRDILRQRFRSLCLMHLIMVAVTTIHAAWQGLIFTYLYAMGMCGHLLILGSFFIIGRSNPRLFSLIYTIIHLAWSPIARMNNKETVFGCWSILFSGPVGVLHSTGSFRYFALSIIAQLYYILTLYKQDFIELSIKVNPIQIIESLCDFTIFGLVTTSLAIYLIVQNQRVAFQYVSTVKSKIEETERQKSFILGFSHEIRNLISSMICNIHLCIEDQNKLNIQENLRTAKIYGDILLQEISNILDTGKVEIGELELNKRPFNIHENLGKAWELMSELINAKQLKGIMMIDKKIPNQIITDDLRLTQILMNLVGNAVKFTSKGGVTLSIEWCGYSTTINDALFDPHPYSDIGDDEDNGSFEKTLATRRFDDTFCFHYASKFREVSNLFHSRSRQNSGQGREGVIKFIVRDTGCGIHSEHMSKLYQKFSQFCDRERGRLGTGLGLFITKLLVKKLGGDIRAFSKLGHGSTFIVCLPVQVMPEEIDIPFQPSNTNINFSHPLRAMVVDDDEFNRKILSSYVLKLGCNLSGIFENGLQAYNEYINAYKQRKRFAFITMDIFMPVMDGKTAVKKIREFEKEHDIHPCIIVMVSANSIQSEINDCLDLNGDIRANGFITKPASLSCLKKILDENLWRNV